VGTVIITGDNFLRLSAFMLLSLGVFRVGLCEESVSTSSDVPQTFAIETYVGRSYNYLDNMVDKDGLPYFNIFWTKPAEAAHDWPDFGDVMSRQLQGAVMARHLTGKESRNEKLWVKKVLSYLDPQTGLLGRGSPRRSPAHWSPRRIPSCPKSPHTTRSRRIRARPPTWSHR